MKTSKPMVYTALFVTLLALLILSPAEATLGNVVKIVYAHGAAQRIAAYAYLVAGGLGIAALSLRGVQAVRNRAYKTAKPILRQAQDRHFGGYTSVCEDRLGDVVAATLVARWAQAVAEVAIVFWIAQFVISAPAQILAWGAFTLNEPRVVGAVWIFLLTTLVYIVARWIGEKNWMAIAAIANAAIYIIVLRGEVNILHPFDPILGSDSLAIKIFYAAIVVTMGVIAFQFSSDRVGRIREAFVPR